jgi:TonB-dependent SusC/RagA subfamily outer membrane receptor
MKRRISILLCVFLAVNSITGLYGQKSGKKITITGTVVDGTQTGIANAIILVDGKKTDNVTDKKGSYKIKVRRENIKIGILTLTNGIKEELINGRKQIDFQFEGYVPDQRAAGVLPGDESVNIGYGVIKNKDLTGNVGEIDGSQSKYDSYLTVYDMLRGLPGVVVSGTTVYIRGPSSINLSSEPLFVVDGVPISTLDYIQPIMVKSINVLNGSAASIYGSRGACGVILITLKKGTDK